MRLLVMSVLYTCGGVCLAETRLDPKVVQRIQTLVSETMSTDSIPAISVAVAVDGEMKWSAAYGLQDLENLTPATPDTIFRLASISKPLTAVLALRLSAAGRLDLDAPIERYVPAFPNKGETITARLLLGHLGGIRHYRDYNEINSIRQFPNLKDALPIFQDDPLLAKPGANFAYSTFGYTLLGVATEAACGQRFGECLREWLLAPAGMNRTTVDDARALVPHRARGYGRERSGQVINTNPVNTSNKIPGGGLASTAEDLVRFALAVQKGSLLPLALSASMWTSQTVASGASTGYGLGWTIMRESPKLVGHGGGQSGATAALLVEPSRGNVVAILCNMEQSGGVGRLAERIMDLLGP